MDARGKVNNCINVFQSIRPFGFGIDIADDNTFRNTWMFRIGFKL